MVEANMKEIYRQQKQAAKQRGIQWDFTYAMWELKWVLSGKLSKRGRGAGKYCMARFNDVGPYSYYNTEIIPFEENSIIAGNPQKACMVDGVYYVSRSEAAKALGIHPTTMGDRIRSKTFDAYYV